MKLRYRIYLITLCAIAGFALLHLGWAWQLKRRLVNLTAGCDRLVIETRVVDYLTRKPSNQILEIKGQEKIGSLAAAIDMWPQPLVQCKCPGNPRLKFFQGLTEVTSLALAHETRLKWPGVFGGEYQLTSGSQEAIKQWFTDQGYDSMESESWGGALIINVPIPP